VWVWGGSGEASGGGRYVTHYPENSEARFLAPQVAQTQRFKATSSDRPQTNSRLPPDRPGNAEGRMQNAELEGLGSSSHLKATSEPHQSAIKAC